MGTCLGSHTLCVRAWRNNWFRASSETCVRCAESCVCVIIPTLSGLYRSIRCQRSAKESEKDQQESKKGRRSGLAAHCRALHTIISNSSHIFAPYTRSRTRRRVRYSYLPRPMLLDRPCQKQRPVHAIPTIVNVAE